ncbi:MAG TPA: hypothetical protein VLW86_09540 [Syntrophorhabdales bacterium]|nr:hypothetical protein [Syntrophorhabdales bacterium]
MQCEKCEQDVETRVCGGCGQTVLRLGPYCYFCGRGLEGQVSRNQAEPSEGSGADEIDFSTRILCSDGACIGVINDQGVCKICGKPYKPEA